MIGHLTGMHCTGGGVCAGSQWHWDVGRPQLHLPLTRSAMIAAFTAGFEWRVGAEEHVSMGRAALLGHRLLERLRSPTTTHVRLAWD